MCESVYVSERGRYALTSRSEDKDAVPPQAAQILKVVLNFVLQPIGTLHSERRSEQVDRWPLLLRRATERSQ